MMIQSNKDSKRTILMLIFVSISYALIAQEIKKDSFDYLGLSFGNSKLVISDSARYKISSRSICTHSNKRKPVAHYSSTKFPSSTSHIEKGNCKFDYKNNQYVFIPISKKTKKCGDSISVNALILKHKLTNPLDLLVINYNSENFLFYANEIDPIDYKILRKENDLHRIVHQLNGYNICFGFHNFNSWKKRSSNSEKNIIQKDIKNLLPERYQKMILDEPIDAKLSNIKRLELKDKIIKNNLGNDELYELTFNVGSKDGVVEGIRFYSKEPNFLYATITEVALDTCKAYLVERKAYVYDLEWKNKIDYSTFIRDETDLIQDE